MSEGTSAYKVCSSFGSDVESHELLTRAIDHVLTTPSLLPTSPSTQGASPLPPLELLSASRCPAAERIHFLLTTHNETQQYSAAFDGKPPEEIACCDFSAPSRRNSGLEICSRYLRRCVGVAMILLLLGSIAMLATSFIHIISVSRGKGIGMLVAYIVSSTLTYYLEGGQAARFMAKGLPPSSFHSMPLALQFVARDERDPLFLQNYMGVRQFFTLGTTTVAGAVILVQLAPVYILGSEDHPASGPLLLASHLIFTTTVCQVLPQIRAERNLSFINTAGALFTYYLAAVFGKIFDTSAPAEWIHQVLVWAQKKTGCWVKEKEIDATLRPSTLSANGSTPSSSPERDVSHFWTNEGVWKYPGNKWPSPGSIAQRLREDNPAAATPRFLLPPAHPMHVPPHVVLTIAYVLSNDYGHPVESQIALRSLFDVAATSADALRHREERERCVDT